MDIQLSINKHCHNSFKGVGTWMAQRKKLKNLLKMSTFNLPHLEQETPRLVINPLIEHTILILVELIQ